ncbi:antibiotic biosynthesis monooxygenase [Streptomyces sp. NPDC020141]|uniref:antibiotic biosynthesis monooxygenase n=1 Tax=Streptomyces sp. NPDC020141 TaxID=3365065 RepID=UPI003797EA6F
MSKPVIAQPDARPDLVRPGVGVVKISTWDVGTPERQRAAVEAIGRAWLSRDWPDVGLLSYTVHIGEDGHTLLHYSQWADEQAYQQFFARYRDEKNAEIDAAVPGIERVGIHSYELYRGAGTGDPRVPGSIAIVEVEFEGPDPLRQRDWVDTVFDAIASDPPPAGGAGPDGGREPREAGISGSFHVGTDGIRVLNYAEWETAEAHRAALAAPGAGIGSKTKEWDRVREYPGVRARRVNRYTPGLSLRPGG